MSRNSNLAKIHIAKKQLCLDDDTYKTIIRDIGHAASGSAKHLSESGMARVLEHFKRCGWVPKKKRGARNRNTTSNSRGILATNNQIKMIRAIWITLSENGVVRVSDESALRSWVRCNTRRYSPHGAGYSAIEFLPRETAIIVIEKMKKWAKRHGINLRDRK